MSHQKITNNWRKFLNEEYTERLPGGLGEPFPDEESADVTAAEPTEKQLAKNYGAATAGIVAAYSDLMKDLTELTAVLFDPTGQISDVDIEDGTVRYTYEDFLEDSNVTVEKFEKGEYLSATGYAVLAGLSALAMVPFVGKASKYTRKGINTLADVIDVENKLKKANKAAKQIKKSLEELKKANKKKSTSSVSSSKPEYDEDGYAIIPDDDEFTEEEVKRLFDDFMEKQNKIDEGIAKIAIKKKDIESKQIGISLRKSTSKIATDTLKALKSGEVRAHIGPGYPKLAGNGLVVNFGPSKSLNPESLDPLEARIFFSVNKELEKTNKKVSPAQAVYHTNSRTIVLKIKVHPRFADKDGYISKYAYPDINNLLKNTIVHELTHARQHARFKLLPGETYEDAIRRDFSAAQTGLKPPSPEQYDEFLNYFKSVDPIRGEVDFAKIYYPPPDEYTSYGERLEAYLKYRLLNPSEIEAMTRDSTTTLSAARKTGKDTLDKMANSIRGDNSLLGLFAHMGSYHTVEAGKSFRLLLETLQELMDTGTKLEKRRKSLARFDPMGKEYAEIVADIEKINVQKNRVAAEIGLITTFKESYQILIKQIQYAKKNFPCSPISINSILNIAGLAEQYPKSEGTTLGRIYDELLNELDYTRDEVLTMLDTLPGNKERNTSDKSKRNTFVPISKKCPKKYISRDQKRFNEEKAINDMVNIITEILSID